MSLLMLDERLNCLMSGLKTPNINSDVRLVAGDDSDVPRNLHSIVVSIHTIATFQALHDYLRARVAGLLSSSRLSGMFAALAASGFVCSTSKRTIQVDDPSNTVEPDAESSADAAPVSTIQRRRSQRLSAKQTGSSSGEAVEGTASAPTYLDSDIHSTFRPHPFPISVILFTYVQT